MGQPVRWKGLTVTESLLEEEESQTGKYGVIKNSRNATHGNGVAILWSASGFSLKAVQVRKRFLGRVSLTFARMKIEFMWLGGLS